MTPSQACIDLIKQFEGCRLEAYKDSVGIATIGYGHVSGVTLGMTITQAEADAYLEADLAVAAKCVNNSVRVPLTQGQTDAICSFVFNLGCGALRNSTLLRKLNDGDDEGASLEFGKWNHAGGVVLAGLTARREAEMEQFLA